MWVYAERFGRRKTLGTDTGDLPARGSATGTGQKNLLT
ncbi:hypothetical protein SAMN05414139_09887 [Burkholderia sp. D7]|nr:hypothetical protein SAMN05414139_09887 [Burkholderia sp. D7]